MATERPQPRLYDSTGEFSLSGYVLSGGVFVAEVRGELDLFNAPRLHTMLDQAIATGAPQIVVDLTGVTTVDSSGLAVLIIVRRRMGNRAGTVMLVADTEEILSKLRLTGLDRIFEIAASREELPDTAA
jgi:anti-sigma B factor antagonist